MTAQTNDPLNAFAYPQATNTPSQAPVAPTDQSTPQTPPTDQTQAPAVDPALATSTPLTTPVDTAVRGNSIEGPAPVAPDPSLLESTSVTEPLPGVTSTPSDPAMATTAPLTATDDSATQVVPPVTDMQIPQENTEEDKPAEEEEHESPLKALARKLSKLREEFVQETPEEGNKEEPKTEEMPAENKPADLPLPNEQVLPSTPTDTPASDPLAANPLPELPKEEVPVATPSTEVDPATLGIVTPTETPSSDVTSVSPMETPAVDSTTTPADDLTPVQNSTPTSTLEQMFPEVVDKPNAEEVKSDVSVDPTVTPAALPTQDSSPSSVIDENDNSQVNPQSVEVASKDSKYPLNINKIMDIAIERNASDIQVSVGYPVMIRIDGTLVSVNEHVVSPANAEELIMPVLTDQKKELLEVNREVDLAYSPLHNADARFRINAYYSKGNLTAAFRLIPSKIRTIEELMLPPIYNQLIKMGQGLVLVTGPTGHGKSTTLAAMLQAINTTRAVHMLTIEDPIEYVFKPSKAVIDQREMHDDTHSWTVALKSALRQDPDVILVGEMRDYETIASTVTLAETGHLVFATLHTNSAAQTVDRIIDVFPENQQAQIRTQLANILEAVVAQRLIPIDGGGRRAVSEIMLGNPAVRNLIREGKTHQIDNVIRTSADIGMVSLEQSLVKLVREGLITMERAQEYAVHPEEVVRLLKS